MGCAHSVGVTPITTATQNLSRREGSAVLGRRCGGEQSQVVDLWQENLLVLAWANFGY